MLNLPVMFLYNFPVTLLRFKWYKIIVSSIFFILNIAALALNIADYGYYPTIQRRLLFEPYTMLPDIIRMIPGLISYHYILFTILLSSAALFIYFCKEAFNKISNFIGAGDKISARIISFVIIIPFVILGIRGGLQLKPLRTAHAFNSDNVSLGYLTLNTTYTVIRSYFQPVLQEITLIDERIAREQVQMLIKSPDEKMLDDNYPFLRQKQPEGAMKKKNVVVFIMESWSAAYIGSITGKKTFTPFFDSLASKGMLFKNFFANGQRSIEAVPCILGSLPAIYNSSLIGSVAESYKYRCLGNIMQENSYTTSFHHGGTTGTMGFDAFSKIAGFKNYYGKESILNLSDSTTDGLWGVCDEPFFLETINVFNSYKENFCSVIFSLSSHDPYTLPENRKDLFEKFKDEKDFEKALRYSDYSLGQFFNEASKQPWFGNTIFLITADHTYFDTRQDFVTTFQVPLLLYSPGFVTPSVISKTASHSDILPIILDLLDITTVHSSMGASVLDSTNPGYAFIKFHSNYSIISDSFVLQNDLEHAPRLYSYKTDTELKKDLYFENKIEAENLNLFLFSFLQVATHAIGENKVYK